MALGRGMDGVADETMQLLLAATVDEEEEVRANAAFAIGVMCQHCADRIAGACWWRPVEGTNTLLAWAPCCLSF